MSTNTKSIEEDILELCKAQKDGISEKILAKTMKEVDTKARGNAINNLLADRRIAIYKRGNELFYKAQDESTTMKEGSLEDRAVYDLIKNSGNKGIWSKDIRTKTQLPMTQLNKTLKTLESKKLIKSVKSVTAGKRKVYMLYDIEPDRSVTGGTWYSEQEFESEFVDMLYEQCYKFISNKLDSVAKLKDLDEKRKRSIVSSRQIRDYISKLRISRVKLSTEDIETVLETISHDGLIERVVLSNSETLDLEQHCQQEYNKQGQSSADSAGGDTEDDEGVTASEDEADDPPRYYRALRRIVNNTGLMRVPCGQCPLLSQCRPGAVISPEKCQYFDRWFDNEERL